MADKKPTIYFEPAKSTRKSDIYVDVYDADNPFPDELERRVQSAIDRATREQSGPEISPQSPKVA